MPERILGGVGHVVSPFDLSRTLLVGGGLLVPCSLPGPPVIKQLMQMVTVVPGQGGQFQSACFLSQFHCGFIDQAIASSIPWVKFYHNLCWLDLQAENGFYYLKCYKVF